jgi:hypothetical protein
MPKKPKHNFKVGDKVKLRDDVDATELVPDETELTPAGQDISTALLDLLSNKPISSIYDLAEAIRVGIKAGITNTMPVSYPAIKALPHEYACFAEAINSFVHECLDATKKK